MKYLGLLLWFWSVGAVAGQVLTTLVTHQGGSYFIEVDALVQAPEPLVRAVITDYNNLQQVNPAIEISTILKRFRQGEFRVETVTEACVLVFCKRLHQVQDVIEAADGSIKATVIPEKSDFRYGYAHVNLWQQATGTRVLVRSEVEPDFWIPPLIGPWLIKRKLRSETRETITNLERVVMSQRVTHNMAAEGIRH